LCRYLLDGGAAYVTAIDVGHGQLAPALRGDRRVSRDAILV
jgi:predicted rRNA methylase YqxC with S4 and FtsJ domains